MVLPNGWRPSRLPGIRDRTIERLPAYGHVFRGISEHAGGLEWLGGPDGVRLMLEIAADVLPEASLWWCGACSAGKIDRRAQDRKGFVLERERFPTPVGLVVFEAGMDPLPQMMVSAGEQPRDAPVDGFLWTARPQGFVLTVLASVKTVKEFLGVPPGQQDKFYQETPPLVPSALLIGRWGERISQNEMPELHTLQVGAGRRPSVDINGPFVQAAAFLDMVGDAAWETVEEDPRAARIRARRVARAAKTGVPPGSAPRVNVIDLSQPRVPAATGAHAAGSGRPLDHQVPVRGHWKIQRYGPGRTLTRKIFVKAHVRGPERAPRNIMTVRKL